MQISENLTREPPRPVTGEELATLERDGVVCLRGMFDAGWVKYLRDAVEREMGSPGKMALDINRDGRGNFFGETFVWANVPDFKAFIFESPAAHLIAEVTRSQKVNLLFDQVLVKEPGTSTETMWHHDAPYWPVLGEKIHTLWLALDPVTPRNGAVEFIPGSHKWGKRFQPRSFTGDGRYKKKLPDVPDIESQRGEYQFLTYELEPGDCTVHHGLTLHAAPGNSTSDVRRRGYLTR